MPPKKDRSRPTRPKRKRDWSEFFSTVPWGTEMSSIPFPTAMATSLLVEMISTFLKTSMSMPSDTIQQYGLKIRNFTFPPSTKVSQEDGSRILQIVFGQHLGVHRFAEHALSCPKFTSATQPPSHKVKSIAVSYVQTLSELIALTRLYQSKEACGRGPLALVAAAIVKASDKQLYVDPEFPVLGARSKATGKRGKPFAADLALVDSDSDSESSSDEASGATADLQDDGLLALVVPPQQPVVVIEYKSKVYDTLNRVDVSDLTELALQAFYVKEGYGKECKIMHILTDLHHYYCFEFGWRQPSYLTVSKFQHLEYDITKVDDLQHLLQFMAEQVSVLLEGKVQDQDITGQAKQATQD